jgi:hypothetical protein
MVGLLSPERFLTKICMVSSGSAEDAREVEEEMLEMLLERMLAVCVDVLVVVRWRWMRWLRWWLRWWLR